MPLFHRAVSTIVTVSRSNKLLSIFNRSSPNKSSGRNIMRQQLRSSAATIWLRNDYEVNVDFFQFHLVNHSLDWQLLWSDWGFFCALISMDPHSGQPLSCPDNSTCRAQHRHREGQGSSLVKSKFSRPFSRYCLNSAHNCEDHLHWKKNFVWFVCLMWRLTSLSVVGQQARFVKCVRDRVSESGLICC